eukprot:306879-Rhodomonas_salina.1
MYPVFRVPGYGFNAAAPINGTELSDNSDLRPLARPPVHDFVCILSELREPVGIPLDLPGRNTYL